MRRALAVIAVVMALLTSSAAFAQTVTKHEAATPWVDPGGTVTDNVDGDIPWERVAVNGIPDVTRLGTYTLTYTVADMAGNVGTAERVVTVVDTTGPVITLQGPNPAILSVGQSLAGVTWGATAYDSFEGEIPADRIIRTGKVSTAFVRDESNPIVLVYKTADLSGNNSVPATRTVLVLRPADTTPPVIVLKP